MNQNSQFINSVNLNAGTDFPYLVMEIINEQSFPRNPGFQVMHWHEDVQFIYLLQGEITVKTLYDSDSLQEGQGIFINKNVVHLVEHTGSCHYYSFVFPDYFLKFYFGSPAAEVVEQIAGREELPLWVFSPAQPWGCRVLKGLEELIQLEKNKTEYYAYEILVKLSSLWLEMAKNIALPPRKREDALGPRMREFLNYIERHYGEDISLKQLASSAHVSKSECLRCFKLSMQTTPFKYLMEYRLSRAAELLASTEDPIGTIALNVGFRQTSHFGKCFKEKTGYSPRDYRQKKSQPRRK